MTTDRRRSRTGAGPDRRRVCAQLLAGPWVLGPLAAAAMAPAPTPTPVGQMVPWPTVRLLDGRTVAAEQLRGRAVVVTFFATDCGYCQRHNQRLDQLARHIGALPLTVIGAALDREVAPVEAYLARQGYTFPVTMDAAPLRAVLTARRSYPVTCVIDRQGVLREVIPGEMAEDDVRGLVKWAAT
ncbi:TlpA disulfide reductase family protein [uncultured Sphaerotilus sp.]|uniref:TlpA disulfide reductase family protein n=1 Tax=uncultured Sphaerotilus sp. TaxID=474984 RepID=UPI0030CA4943